MPYIDVTIETDPVDLAADAFSYIEGKVPGWLPSPGNLEAWLIESLAQIAGELRQLVGLVPEDIFTFYGETIMGLPPYDAVSATASTTWTAIDTAGYTVGAGTVVGIQPTASQDVYAFEVVSDFTIANGQTTSSAVAIRALQPGADASGITGTVQMIDVLDFIQTVTLDAPTSGGVDAETPDAYLDRLSDLLTLMTPRPILPNDFAIMVQREIPGVYRACAIDLWKNDTGTPNTPRCCTVVGVDAAGQPLSSTIKTQMLSLLQSQREINFLVYVGDPTYTSIDVTFQVTVYPGYVTADVQSRVIAALQNYLNPSQWGLPPYGDPGTISWINENTVRYLEITEQINRVDGVRYVKSTTTINKTGSAAGTADIVMPGIAPLTTAGTITGTASLT